MNKQETFILKGVAILFMIFGHLFYRADLVSLCHSFIFIGNKPLVQILCRMTGPIFFFLFFSGYGLYHKREGIDRNRYHRIFKLFINYWIILTVFLFIGHYLFPSQYPGNWEEIIQNYTGYHTTYNQECWFLLPFAILSLCSRFIFKLFEHQNSYIVLVLLLILNLVTSFVISRYGNQLLFNRMYIYIPFLVIHFLYPFCVGAISAKESWLLKIRKIRIPNIILSFALLLLIVLRCCIDTSIVQTEFVFVFVALFLCLKRPLFFDKGLSLLGEHSMNMWMIHTWFCYYLFKNFIYGLKYPLLIFIFTVFLSVATSYLVREINLRIEHYTRKITYSNYY